MCLILAVIFSKILKPNAKEKKVGGRAVERKRKKKIKMKNEKYKGRHRKYICLINR